MKLYAALVIVLLTGCMTTEKATNYLLKKDKLGIICATNYPPRIEYKEGEIKVYTDTTYLPGDSVPCPPETSGNTTYIHTKPLIVTKTKSRTDTVYQANTAMEDVLRNEILRQQDTIGDKEVEIMVLTNKLKASKKLNVYLIGVIVLAGLAFVARLYFKSKRML